MSLMHNGLRSGLHLKYRYVFSVGLQVRVSRVYSIYSLSTTTSAAPFVGSMSATRREVGTEKRLSVVPSLENKE